MKKRNLRASRLTIVGLFIVFVLSACSTIDCPLNNRVYATFKLAGSVTTLTDSLTVSTTRAATDGGDTILVNRSTATDSLSLPLSYSHDKDTYFFSLAKADTNIVVTDTVVVAKTNTPHFESVDCSPNFFHTITDVSYTRHAIDSIVINNSNVTYNDQQSHFLLYLKNNDN